MAPLSPLTVPNSPTHSSRCAPESDTATVSYSLNAAITRSSMALHPDLLDKHLLLLSWLAILNPLLAFPTYVRMLLASLSTEQTFRSRWFGPVHEERIIVTILSRAHRPYHALFCQFLPTPNSAPWFFHFFVIDVSIVI